MNRWQRVGGVVFYPTAVGRGFLVFLAACGGDSATNTSAPAQTASVVVSPTTPVLSVGASVPLQAQAQDAGGQTVSNVTIFWSTSDTAVATVSSAGVVTGRAVGTAQVAASAEGKSAIATVTVVPIPVASVAVVPSSATVTKGSTTTLQAVTYDAAKNILSGRPVVWATSASQVATVDSKGVVKGILAGTASITATSEGKSGSATVTVTGR